MSEPDTPLTANIVMPQRRPPPRIFYICQDNNQISGGEKHNYQHVDILNRVGYEAYVLHQADGFRQTWFANSTPVVYRNNVTFRHDSDYLVVSESLGLNIAGISGRKVIFNKNVYSGFNRLGLDPKGARAYLSDDVVAIMCVSAHNSEFLRFAYPDKPIVVVQGSIKPELFTYRPLSERRRRIAYATKAHYDGRMLFQFLMGRSEQKLNRLNGVEWIALVDMRETEVIETLQSALVLVFLSTYEGLPRLPLEAMACGCLVCAYDCGAQATYLPSFYQFQYGDIVSMARHIERLFDVFEERPDALSSMTQEARCIAERFSDAAQEETVASAWKRILEIRPS